MNRTNPISMEKVAPTHPEVDRLLTLKDVERLAGVSRPTVYRWRHEHGLKMVKVGACVRVRESDWVRFLERYTINDGKDLEVGAK